MDHPFLGLAKFGSFLFVIIASPPSWQSWKKEPCFGPTTQLIGKNIVHTQMFLSIGSHP